jgi:hypothetical protein
MKKISLKVCGSTVFATVQQLTDSYEVRASGEVNQLGLPEAMYCSGFGASERDAVADYVDNATRRMSDPAFAR